MEKYKKNLLKKKAKANAKKTAELKKKGLSPAQIKKETIKASKTAFFKKRGMRRFV